MKLKSYFTILLILFCLSVFAEEFKGHYKKQLTPYDVFFGKEDVYQICYPKAHRTYFDWIIFLSIATIGSLLFILKATKRNNKLLEIKNEIIATQNKELLDSIIYAQRIQKAILPNDSKNAKVYYQPKNIVSGDFYWIYSYNNYCYYSVIDCTGHGVPGAFLSVLAHSSINDAIIAKHLTNPTEILQSMNDFINLALNHERNEHIKDGMEVGICVFNHDTNTLEYAGASINLLYINNAALSVIKATKCTVGQDVMTGERAPLTHKIVLEKGDRFYMHSDGITDQFGESTNKKFSSKRLKQIIENTAVYHFEEQQANIEQELVIWKGNIEQTDDMLIMAVEV